jgi:hypothetical protein
MQPLLVLDRRLFEARRRREVDASGSLCHPPDLLLSCFVAFVLFVIFVLSVLFVLFVIETGLPFQ